MTERVKSIETEVRNACRNPNQPHNYRNCLQAVLPIYLVSAHLWSSGRG